MAGTGLSGFAVARVTRGGCRARWSSLANTVTGLFVATRKGDNYDSHWGVDERQQSGILVGTRGTLLRRLYSTFAGGLPGTGLLLMRLVAGSALVLGAGATLWRDPPVITTISCAFLGLCGILLIPGLWTPITGTLVALLEASHALTRTGDPWTSILLGTIAGALAMLGPGLWSVDARRFGWKRVQAPPRKSRSSSS